MKRNLAFLSVFFLSLVADAEPKQLTYTLGLNGHDQQFSVDHGNEFLDECGAAYSKFKINETGIVEIKVVFTFLLTSETRFSRYSAPYMATAKTVCEEAFQMAQDMSYGILNR